MPRGDDVLKNHFQGTERGAHYLLPLPAAAACAAACAAARATACAAADTHSGVAPSIPRSYVVAYGPANRSVLAARVLQGLELAVRLRGGGSGGLVGGGAAALVAAVLAVAGLAAASPGGGAAAARMLSLRPAGG